MVKKYSTVVSLSVLLLGILSFQGCANGAQPVAQSKGISSSFAKSTGAKKEALIVGVSDYRGTRADLNGIDRDVEKMKNLFERWGFTTKVLYDEESMDLIRYLDQYAQKLGKDDFFAFYYTGHGSHKKDATGDEPDGQDETLVLSDGQVNKHLIDDILYDKFNAIDAKKLVFFDSCHSGTVFRSISGKAQAKTLKPEDVTESFVPSRSKGLSQGSDQLKNGEYIVFSSSRDTEESLATPTGSLFTNSVAEVFTNESLADKPLNEINKILVDKVLAYAKKTEGKPHHPRISYSSNSLGEEPLKNFILKKSLPEPATQSSKPSTPSTEAVSTSTTPTSTNESVQETLEALMKGDRVKPMVLHYDKQTYREGESVTFALDTQGDRGYLSIFYVDGNDVTILYPNPFVQTKVLGGRYHFPDDLSNGKFTLEAYKSCGSCPQEKTTIYTLLTSEPVTNLSTIQGKGLTSFAKGSHDSKIMSRAVRIKATKPSTQPQLGKYEFIVK